MMLAPVPELVQAMAQLATSAAAAAIWQGVVLTGLAALGLRLLPETPAPVRFAIWFAVFLLVAGLPFATVSFGHAATGTTAAPGSHPWLTIDSRWCIWIAAIWAVASLVRAYTLVAAAFRVRALWKRAEPIRVAFAQAITRNAQVCVSDEVDRPTVIGFFSPRIVIPAWLIEKLSPEELEQVVLHEAGHLSRRDDWLNLFQKLALVIFPLNPALSWVERRLCFERELACDERVLRATGAPKAYARCLATLAEYRLQRQRLVRDLALALGALGRESELAQRVLRILSGCGRMKRGHARLVFGGSVLSLVFAATALEHTPQLVGFAHPTLSPSESQVAAMKPDSVEAVAVRASVAPAAQWRTVGDAAPHLSKPAAVSSPPKLASSAKRAQFDGAPAQWADPASSSPALYDEPRVIETTTRQVMADGDLVVTRLVTVTYTGPVSNPDATRSISDAPQADVPERHIAPQRNVRPYAAVPVQGGWLVFQL